MTKEHKTSIGGQAVIEGVMMRGVEKTTLAVRNTKGEIIIEDMGEHKKNSVFLKIPILRGIISFVSSMITGYKAISRSAELSGFDAIEEENKETVLEDPEKAEKNKKKMEKIMSFAMILSVVLGIALAILLFTVLPAYITKGLWMLTGDAINPYRALIEGFIRLFIFLIYILIVSKQKDIKRIFQYHGAEHKTIFCYEKGLELTCDNIRAMSRFHPRCGTSFLILVMLVSILIFMLPIFTWENILLRICTKLLFLPLIAGISYELIKIAGRYDNIFTKIISAPGIWLQRLTTAEPDDSQIEVAVASLKAVLTGNREDDKW